MASANPSSSEALSGEILAAAQRECDEIIRRAREESDSLLAAATAEAEKIRREKLDSARAEAARRKETMLATIPVEAGRLRSKSIEIILESVRQEAQRRLLAGDFDVHETIVALAAQAIRQMPGTDFVLQISAVEHSAIGDKLAEEIRQRAGRSTLNVTVTADPAMSGGGIIVRDAAGTVLWDNRLVSRLERLWPELRRLIATRASLVGNHEPGGGPT